MQPSYLRHTLAALFVTTLIISNIIAAKIGDFYGFYLPVAVIVFPVSYILGDIITEVYGYGTMRRVIWTGFLCNLLAVIAMWFGKIIPAAPFFEGQGAYEAILGSTPRILVASFIAYLIGSFVNAGILSRLKVLTKGKHLWLRTISSTIIGEGLDSLVFIGLAFGGVFATNQVITLIVSQWIFKIGFEIIATPLTYGAVGWIKRQEKTDTFDTNVRLNPFQL